MSKILACGVLVSLFHVQVVTEKYEEAVFCEPYEGFYKRVQADMDCRTFAAPSEILPYCMFLIHSKAPCMLWKGDEVIQHIIAEFTYYLKTESGYPLPFVAFADEAWDQMLLPLF